MDPVLRRVIAVLSMAPAMAHGHAQMANSGRQMAGEAASPQSGEWKFYHEHVLGTSLEISIKAHGRESAREAEKAVLGSFDKMDRIFSAHRAESEFSRWEQSRFEAVHVSPVLFAVLKAFDQWREKTNGALDPSVAAAMQLWRQATSEGRRPDEDEIARTLEAIKQPHWSLDADQQTATRLSETPLALASFVKSWIADQAAHAALDAGAKGVMLNVGGDVVVRGAMQQRVDLVDPRHAADNLASLDSVMVSDRAVATSGIYRRGFSLQEGLLHEAPQYGHLFDPHTALPVAHVLSSTVIAADASTAGALATAFSVMPVSDSQKLATAMPGVDYLLVLADGSQVRSVGWNAHSMVPAPQNVQAARVAYALPAHTSGMWNPAFELTLGIELPRINDARYRRPYVAVWVEDGDHYPVRTLALWSGNPRWLPDLKQWYRDDQIRMMSEGSDISRTVGSATRPAGSYILKWDGRDNEGHLVKAGNYTVVVEAVREHGGYQIVRHAMNFNAHADRAELPAGSELGKISFEYKKR